MRLPSSIAVIAGTILLFLIVRPPPGTGAWVEIPGVPFAIAMAAIWAGFCALDMGYTVRHGGLVCRYERNPVLRTAVRRLGGLRAGVAAALIMESAAVMLLPFAISFSWDPHIFGVLCFAAAGAHAAGFVESASFVRQHPD